jgi:hypothetical protein
MNAHRNWTLLFALVVGAVGVILLLSLRLEAVAESSGPVRADVPIVRQGTAAIAQIGGGGVSSGAYTVCLPLVARNSGGPLSLFGVQMFGNLAGSSLPLNKATAAGVRWIRAGISWAGVEPVNCTPDLYDWRFIDAQVQAIESGGFEPLLTLGGNPSWAATYPMGPVENIADLQEFVGALVERFDGDGYEDAPGSPVVRYWEIYNEPDNTDEGHAIHGGYGYWGNDGAGYAALLDAIYPVVKAASSQAQVVFGGVSHDYFLGEGGIFNPDFVDDVLSNCTGTCFDVMSFHYYPFYRYRREAYGRDVIGKANYLRSKLASYGFDRPLVCTETSWPTASFWGSLTLQSRYVVAGYVRSMAAGLAVQIWYSWWDVDSSMPGLLDSEFEPKPAYYAYQTLTAQLGPARYVRSLTEAETGSEDIEGYVFSVPGADGWERLDVMWYDCPEYQKHPPEDCSPGASETMMVPASVLQITDLYGNSSIRYDASDGTIDGQIALEIGPNPIYVEYDPPFSAPNGHSEAGADGGISQYDATYGVIDDRTTVEGIGPAPVYVNDGPPFDYPNCRFGVGAVGDVSQYNVAALNVGWYVDWRSQKSPHLPAGLEYVQTMRLAQVGTDGWALVSPAPSQFTATVQANPGSIWLVGNEPDSPFQNDMVPQAYAHAYHDVYYMIKGLDPAAQVAIGGIVQPTPLRFAYLDAMWEAYYWAYGETMPVDIWNIHTFILRETINPPNPEPCGSNTIPVWGAYIPPGSSAQTGELYCVRDQDDIEIFKQRIRTFRQWMANKGQRDKPLVVTEYGILFPEDYSDEDGALFSRERVRDFMYRTFDFFLNETDPNTGYSYDGNRLVQRWAWYSLDANLYDWGGTLFDPATKALRPLGEDFRAYTRALAPTVDLSAARAFANPAALWYEGAPVTATLKAVVSNIGNTSTALPTTVTFYDGPPGKAGSSPIGSAQLISAGLCGCADYEIVEMKWPGLGAGVHTFYVLVESAEDSGDGNNVAEGVVLVAAEQRFLPLVLEGFSG